MARSWTFPALCLLPAACALLATPPGPAEPSDPQQAGFAWDRPVEPPLRVRVALGDEEHTLALGSTTATADGRSLSVALESTRRLAIPAAFRLDYPCTWSFAGAGGTDGAWAYLAGHRAALQLRWHQGDARATLDELVTNLERTQASKRTADRLILDGRELEGFAVATRSAAIGSGFRPQAWRQRAFAFEDRAGRAWLFVLHECTEPLELPAYARSVTLGLVPSSGDEQDEGAEAPRAASLEALVASFRWDGE